MFTPMISFRPRAIMGHFKATSPLPSGKTFYPPVKMNCCQRLPSGLLHSPSHIRKNAPRWQRVTSVPSDVCFYSYGIFLIFRLSGLLHHDLWLVCPSPECNKGFWSMKVLSWQALCWDKDFHAHSPRPNANNGCITSRPLKAILINEPFSLVFKVELFGFLLLPWVRVPCSSCTVCFQWCSFVCCNEGHPQG